MAARLNKWTPEIVRKRIKTAHIVRRLQRHIAGKLEMSSTQIKACEILLRKTLPDQSSVEHSGQLDMVNDIRDLSIEQIDQELASTRALIAETRAALDGETPLLSGPGKAGEFH